MTINPIPLPPSRYYQRIDPSKFARFLRAEKALSEELGVGLASRTMSHVRDVPFAVRCEYAEAKSALPRWYRLQMLAEQQAMDLQQAIYGERAA